MAHGATERHVGVTAGVGGKAVTFPLVERRYAGQADHPLCCKNRPRATFISRFDRLEIGCECGLVAAKHGYEWANMSSAAQPARSSRGRSGREQQQAAE